MAIQRWDPLRELMELQQKMNHLFEQTLARSAGSDPEAAAGNAWKPDTDLFEDDDRYVLRADLPGVAAADVEIRIDDGTLTLRGERKMDDSVGRDAYLRVERPYGRFSVQMSLAPSVDPSAVQATHKNGVIEILLPKKKAETPSHVEISSH